MKRRQYTILWIAVIIAAGLMLSGFQVIPFIENTGQARMRFAGPWKRRIASQRENAAIGLGGQMELVFCFLHVAQAGCGAHVDDDIPGRLANRHGFGIGLAGGGAVALEVVGEAQVADDGMTREDPPHRFVQDADAREV